MSDRSAAAIRWDAGQRTLSQPEHGGVVCPLSRSYRDDSRDRGGCIFDVPSKRSTIDDPVLFCEHKFLYNHLKAVRLPDSNMPSFKARLSRQGRDATVVTYGAMLHESLAAAEELAEDGYEIEIVDLRTVKPLNRYGAGLGGPNRAHVVWLKLGLGVAWRRRLSLGSPPKVLACSTLLRAAQCEGSPVPYHPHLWSAHRPTASAIASAMRRLLEM